MDRARRAIVTKITEKIKCIVAKSRRSESANSLSCFSPFALSRQTSLPSSGTSAPSVLMTLLIITLLLPAPASAAAARPEVVWTLLVQLPERGAIEVEHGGGRLRGAPAQVVARLGRGGARVRSIRRIVFGKVSLESRRVREVALAGRMLIVTVAIPGGRRVRAVSTNRVPISENDGYLTLLNLQLVAEGELHARAPFAIVEERGRTAVLFQ